MDSVERRRSQNRMAQRRFRSKRASQSAKKSVTGTDSSTKTTTTTSIEDDATTTGGGGGGGRENHTLIPYSSSNPQTHLHGGSSTTPLSHESHGLSKSAQRSVSSASTDLLNTLSADVQDMHLPNDRGGFLAAMSSLSGFVHQGPDHGVSLSHPNSQSPVAQGMPSLVDRDGCSHLSSTLTDKLRDHLQSSPCADMHANLGLNSSPCNETFHVQAPGSDHGPSFNINSDQQLTPSSLPDASEAESIMVDATTGYQLEFCQDCSALRIRSPSQCAKADVICGSLDVWDRDKESNAQQVGGPRNDGSHVMADDGDVPFRGDFESSIHIAAESGHSDLVDMLIRSGSLVDESDSEGNTPLHRATSNRKLHVIQRLLWHGANPNSMNKAGRTPVHIAVSLGSMEIVETLLRFGGDLNKRAGRKSNRTGSNHGLLDDT